jgi:hypothetical protein
LGRGFSTAAALPQSPETLEFFSGTTFTFGALRVETTRGPALRRYTLLPQPENSRMVWPARKKTAAVLTGCGCEMITHQSLLPQALNVS